MKVFYSIAVLLLALAASGQTAFIRTYGMSGTFNEGKGIVAFSDSTYIIAGNRQTPGGQSSAWLFKVDSAGSIVWEKYFDSYVLSSAENLSKHGDSSVVLAGTALQGTDYSMLVARVSTSGDIIWEKTYGTHAWDQGLCTTSDKYGQVWLTGYGQAYDTLDQDILIYKLDGQTGDSLFSKRIDDGYNDKGVYIDTIPGDNLLLSSHSLSASNEMIRSKIWRLDLNLDTVWTHIPGAADPSASIRVVECLFMDTIGRIVFSGELLPDTGTVYRHWYGCLEPNGTLMFEHIYGPYYLKNIRRGIVNRLNEYYFTGGIFPYYFGFGNSDIGLWVDSAGYAGFRYFGAVQDEEGTDLDFAADGGLVMLGTTKNYGPGVNNIFLVKVGANLTYNPDDYQHYAPVSAYSQPESRIYPNPSNGTFRIDYPEADESRIDIFSLQGVSVFSGEYRSGESVTLSGLCDGIYLVKITTSAFSYNFRLLLQQK